MCSRWRTGEDDAPIGEHPEPCALIRPGSSQQIEGIALCREMTAQTSPAA